MKLLAIDTATEGCSAALWQDGELTSRLVVEPRRHAELILPMIEEVLAEAGASIPRLDALAFGCGPGAFTGLRIATGVIQGIAFAADLPVVPVSTLRALAQRVYLEYGHDSVLAAFDARMNEIYWGCYQLAESDMRLLGEESVISPHSVSLPTSAEWVGAGSGWAAYAGMLADGLDRPDIVTYPQLISRADEIARLAIDELAAGNSVSAEQALPVYLRNQVAKKKVVAGNA